MSKGRFESIDRGRILGLKGAKSKGSIVERSALTQLNKLVKGKSSGMTVAGMLDDLQKSMVSPINVTRRTPGGLIRTSSGTTGGIPFAMADVRGIADPQSVIDDALERAAKPVELLVIRGAGQVTDDLAVAARLWNLKRAGTTVVVEGAQGWTGVIARGASSGRLVETPRGFTVMAVRKAPAGAKAAGRKAVPGKRVTPGKKTTAGRKTTPGEAGSGAATPPPDGPPPGPPAPGGFDSKPIRHVNAVLTAKDTDQPAPTDQPLKVGTRYDLLVNIGAYRQASLLSSEDGQWPDDALPDGDLWLRAVLRMDGWPKPVTATFSLPARGESFVCECPPDGAHLDSCQPEPWLRLPIRTPRGQSVWQGDLVVYFGAVPVHVQRLTLPVGNRFSAGPRSRVIYRLTRAFVDLGPLAERTASVYLDARDSRVLVNAVGFVDNPFSIETNAADAAVRDARKLLYGIHLRVEKDGEKSNYGADFSKKGSDFEADLRRLAFAGMSMYDGLFHSDSSYQALPYQIRTEARARTRPAVLSIVMPPDEFTEDQQVPWSLIYDLPLGMDVNRYRPCESVRAFGPGGTTEPVPAHCPFGDHLDGDEDDVLCLFGFWGLSCLLEHPPHTQTEPRRVVVDAALPVSMLMATDTQLDPAITSSHVADLTGRIGLAVEAPAIAVDADLGRALAPETSDIAYLYCHCGYYSVVEGGSKSLYLNFGDTQIGATTIGKWARRGNLWPRPHWPQRKPLVVLNGCHTVERTSGTLSNFVDSFINRAGASGVIGTEVALEQAMASHMMGIFMQRLCQGDGVGDALRQTRWQMIRLGNVMGLAYTPYCLSDLSLRGRTPEAAAA